MDQIVAFYNQSYFVLAILLTIVLVGVVVELALMHNRLARLTRNYERLFRDAKGQSLEKVFETQMARADANARLVEQLDHSFRRVAEDMRNTVRHVGFVRYNPFNDTGGDQSFSVALLDDLDNGLVITSLYNRAGTRVYAKPIDKGQPLYPLSNEEKEAIQSARKVRK